MSQPARGATRRSGATRDRLVDRAMMASGALVAAAVVTTGLFIGKIAHSAASTISKNTNQGTTQNSGTGDDNGGFPSQNDDGGFPSQNNGGGVLPNQNNQPPVGGSHGS